MVYTLKVHIPKNRDWTKVRDELFRCCGLHSTDLDGLIFENGVLVIKTSNVAKYDDIADTALYDLNLSIEYQTPKSKEFIRQDPSLPGQAAIIYKVIPDKVPNKTPAPQPVSQPPRRVTPPISNSSKPSKSPRLPAQYLWILGIGIILISVVAIIYNFAITQGNESYVEVINLSGPINSTPVLRIHADSSFESKVVATAHSGDKFPYIRVTANGKWVQIEYSSGKKGWIYSKYANVVTNNDSSITPIATKSQ